MGQRHRVARRRSRRGRGALAGGRARTRDDLDRARGRHHEPGERPADEGGPGGHDRCRQRVPRDGREARAPRARVGGRAPDLARGLHEVGVGDGRHPGRAVSRRRRHLPPRLLAPEPRRLEGERLPAEGIVPAADDLLHGCHALGRRRGAALAGQQLVAREHALDRERRARSGAGLEAVRHRPAGRNGSREPREPGVAPAGVRAPCVRRGRTGRPRTRRRRPRRRPAEGTRRAGA